MSKCALNKYFQSNAIVFEAPYMSPNPLDSVKIIMRPHLLKLISSLTIKSLIVMFA